MTPSETTTASLKIIPKDSRPMIQGYCTKCKQSMIHYRGGYLHTQANTDRVFAFWNCYRCGNAAEHITAGPGDKCCTRECDANYPGWL